jgi:hypothetical protein
MVGSVARSLNLAADYAGARVPAVTGVTERIIIVLLFARKDLRRLRRASGSAKDALRRATPPFKSEKSFKPAHALAAGF